MCPGSLTIDFTWLKIDLHYSDENDLNLLYYLNTVTHAHTVPTETLIMNLRDIQNMWLV